jgi:LCP family protein required for cell wall assembly
MESRLEKRNEKKTKRKKMILIVAGFLMMLVVASAATLYFGFHDTAQPATTVIAPTVGQKVNILLLGIDKRRDDIGRSNVTCVVSIDTATKKVSMLWVPRDSRVEIPENGWNKIGHAYAYGGPKLSEQTVANLLGIPIDYYVSINMEGFKKVINALGGVDIKVDKRMYYYDPYDAGEVDNNGLIDLKPGLQHMDGNVALEYVRFRHDEMGDIGRIARQQKFAKALLADVITPSIITKLPSVVKEANSAFETDMPLGEMLSLMRIVTAAYKQGLNTQMVSGRPLYIDNISYWIPDIPAMRKQVAELQGLSPDDTYWEAAHLLSDRYAAELAQATEADHESKASSTPATVRHYTKPAAAAVTVKHKTKVSVIPPKPSAAITNSKKNTTEMVNPAGKRNHIIAAGG